MVVLPEHPPRVLIFRDRDPGSQKEAIGASLRVAHGVRAQYCSPALHERALKRSMNLSEIKNIQWNITVTMDVFTIADQNYSDS